MSFTDILDSIDPAREYGLEEIVRKKLLYSPRNDRPMKSLNRVRLILRENGVRPKTDKKMGLMYYAVSGEKLIEINKKLYS